MRNLFPPIPACDHPQFSQAIVALTEAAALMCEIVLERARAGDEHVAEMLNRDRETVVLALSIIDRWTEHFGLDAADTMH